ncbi:FUSC family protein [Leeuwenhoekiella sp. MAR_2009_132]|uniref:FUSC family protein n=1 Tax=Leeuwenhoekiella sp. MAR_2009_132 TaxID=1392489 RepID=UPI000491F07E|nr:FUSC family membrane protein [Leeuwenhoekiella sp. MAR_2009_132]
MFRFQQHYNSSIAFAKSTDFAKAILVTIGVVTPILVGYYLDYLGLGIAIGTGVLLSSPSSVSGSLKNKRIGILLSSLIATLVSFIGAYIPDIYWIQLPYLGIMTFALAFIAVYGFRASLVGFSGLFALVLSFANLSSSGMPPYERSLLIGLGGILYLLLTLLYDVLAPKKQTEELLETAIELSSRYIEARGQFLRQSIDRDTGLKKLFTVQSDFNDHLEKLREILLDSRHASGTSSYYRKRFLVLGELVDLLELSLTSPIPPARMHEILKKYPQQLYAFVNLNKAQTETLRKIAHTDLKKNKVDLNALRAALKETKNKIDNYKAPTASTEDDIILHNLYELQENQTQRIINIAQILDRNKIIKNTNSANLNDLEGFVTKQDYSFQILLDNLNKDSPIFKHALRIAFIAVLGFGLGNFFEVQNPYWILLTIIVIMRPSYGLTKERSKNRIIGTLLGAALATGIVYVFRDNTLFRILAVLSFIMAHASLQKNYRTGAFFITLSIIFAYALLRPDILAVIQFRVLDTSLGAALTALASAFLWPTREAKSLKFNLAESLRTNRNYLQVISSHYETKKQIETHYKLARKKAFLATATVNAAIQRLLQEPGATGKLTGKLYELVVLNHAFLGALASIGAYLRNHNTTHIDDVFSKYKNPIFQNLDTAIAVLENKSTTGTLPDTSKELEVPVPSIYINKELHEAHILTEQLKWLKKLSEDFNKQLKALHT